MCPVEKLQRSLAPSAVRRVGGMVSEVRVSGRTRLRHGPGGASSLQATRASAMSRFRGPVSSLSSVQLFIVALVAPVAAFCGGFRLKKGV